MKTPLYCNDCDIEMFVSDNMIMIKDCLWFKIAKKEDILCDFCIEKRLGRHIQEEDFKSPGIPCNEAWKWNKLSPEQKEKIRLEYNNLTPELRKNFLVPFI